MRASAVLFCLLLAAPAAADELEARRLAARAMLTARVMDQLDDAEREWAFAKPLLVDVAKIVKPDGAADDLLTAVGGVLDRVDTLSSDRRDAYVAACRACARFAGDAKKEWTSRGLRNDVGGAEAPGFGRMEEWKTAFNECADAQDRRTRGFLEASAETVLGRPLWKKPSRDRREADRRIALLEALRKAAPEAGLDLLRLRIRQAAGELGLRDRSATEAAYGLWEISRILGVFGDDKELALPRLRIVASEYLNMQAPAYSLWYDARKHIKDETVDLGRDLMPAVSVEAGTELLELPVVVLVPRLRYLIRVKSGAHTIDCIASWADAEQPGHLELKLPKRLPAGYLVLRGLEEGGRTMLFSKNPWSHQRIALALFRMLRGGKGARRDEAVRFFKRLMNGLDPDFTNPETILRQSLTDTKLGGPLAAELCAVLQGNLFRGVRLPDKVSWDRIPIWARKRFGWGNVLAADGPEPGKTYVVHDVVELGEGS